jgi:hypothetical protein
VRRREPGGEQRRILKLGLFEGFELPGTAVNVVELIARFRGYAARLGDSLRGLDAPAHRAGVDFAWSPAACNAPGNKGGLCASLLGELERRATAKPFGLDAFNVSVSDQKNFAHLLGSDSLRKMVWTMMPPCSADRQKAGVAPLRLLSGHGCIALFLWKTNLAVVGGRSTTGTSHMLSKDEAKFVFEKGMRAAHCWFEPNWQTASFAGS